jgi:putative sigma-54 modulation protein
VDITPEIRRYIDKKLPRIEKYTQRIQSIDLVIEKVGYQHHIEVRLKAGPISINAKSADADLLPAIDSLIDKMERLLRKNTQKLRGNKKHKVETPRKDFAILERKGPKTGSKEGNGRKTRKRAGANGSGSVCTLNEIGISVYSSERQPVTPISVEDAAIQLHMSDDNFLCFINDIDQQMNVIYRRKDNNFGLIEPVG